MPNNDKWSQYQVSQQPAEDKWAKFQVGAEQPAPEYTPTDPLANNWFLGDAPLTKEQELPTSKRPTAPKLEQVLTAFYTPDITPDNEDMSLSRAFVDQQNKEQASKLAKEDILFFSRKDIPIEEKQKKVEELKKKADEREQQRKLEYQQSQDRLEESYEDFAKSTGVNRAHIVFNDADYLPALEEKGKRLTDAYRQDKERLSDINKLYAQEADKFQRDLNLFLPEVTKVADPYSINSAKDPNYLKNSSSEDILKTAGLVGIEKMELANGPEAYKLAYDRNDQYIATPDGYQRTVTAMSAFDKNSYQRAGLYQMIENYGELLEQQGKLYEESVQQYKDMEAAYQASPTKEGYAALQQYRDNNLKSAQEYYNSRLEDYNRLLDLSKTSFSKLEEKERKEFSEINDFDPKSWTDNLSAAMKTLANKNSNALFGFNEAGSLLTAPFLSKDEFKAERIASYSKQKERQFFIPSIYQSTELTDNIGNVNWANLVSKNLETTAFSLEIAGATALTGGAAAEMGLAATATVGMMNSIIPVTMAMTYGDFYALNLETGLSPNQASTLAGFQSLIEGITERVSPLEAKIFNPEYWAKSGFRQMSKDQAIRTLYKQLTGKEIKQEAIDYLMRGGKALAQAPYTILQETSEELLGDALTSVLDPAFAAHNQGYVYDPMTLETLKRTAISSASTMALMGLFGGAQKLAEKQLPSYQLDIATNPELYLEYLEHAKKLQAIPELPLKDGSIVSSELLYEKSKQEIAKLGGIYNANKAVIDNLEEPAERASLVGLLRSQSAIVDQMAKYSGIATTSDIPELTKLQDSLDKVQERIESYTKIALENIGLSQSQRNKRIAGRMTAEVQSKFTDDYINSIDNRQVLNYFKNNLSQRKDYANDKTFSDVADVVISKLEGRLQFLLEEDTKRVEKDKNDAEINNTAKEITLPTIKGDKKLKYNTEYYVGQRQIRDKDNHLIINFPVIQILEDNGNGTIKILSDGKESSVKKSSLAQFSFGEKALMDSQPKNDIRRIWFENRNNIVNFKFAKDTPYHSKDQKGRLDFDPDTRELFFVFKDKKGKIQRIKVTDKDFAAQAGYKEPKITFVRNLAESEAEYQNRQEQLKLADFTKINNQNLSREAAIQAFIDKLEAPIGAINKRIDSREKKYQKISDTISIINDLLEKKFTIQLQDLKPILTKEEFATLAALPKKKVTPLRLVPVLSSKLEELVTLRNEIRDEIVSLEDERQELADRIGVEVSTLEDVLDSVEFKKDESIVETLKIYRKELKGVLKEYNDAVKANQLLVDKLNSVIENVTQSIKKIIDSFLKRFPSLPGVPSRETLDEYLDSAGQFLSPANISYLDRVIAEYDSSIAKELERLDEEANLSEIEGQLEEALVEKKKLQDAASEMQQYHERIAILNKALRFLSTKEKEFNRERSKTRIQENRDIINSYFLKYQTKNQTNSPEEDKDLEDKSSKKSLENLFQSTTSESIYDSNGQLRPAALAENNQALVRLQNFLNTVQDTSNLTLVVVTTHNAARLGLDGIIFTGKDTTNTGENEENYDIRVVVARKIGDDVQFIDQEGQAIETPTPDNVIYTAIPLAKLTWSSGEKSYAPYSLKEEDEKELAAKLVETHKEFRRNLIEASKSEDPELEITGISRGFARKEEDLRTRNSVVGTILPEDVDLSGEKLITVPTVAESGKKTGTVTSAMRKDAVSMPIGRPVLNYNQHLVFLNNRKFTDAEINKLIKCFVYLYEEAKKKGGKLDERVIAYLHKVLYWRNPEYASKATKEEQDLSKIGVAQIWYDSEKNAIMLGKMNDGIPFFFEPDDIFRVDALRTFLSSIYHNVDNTDLTGKQFEEIIDIDKGQLKTRVWPSYQEYLLSDKMEDGKTPRNTELIPLTTNIQPSVAGEPNFSGRYINYKNPQISDATEATEVELIRAGTNIEVVSTHVEVPKGASIEADKIAIYNLKGILSQEDFDKKVYHYYNKKDDFNIFFRVSKDKKISLVTIADLPSHDTELSDSDVIVTLEQRMQSKDRLPNYVEISEIILPEGTTEKLEVPKQEEDSKSDTATNASIDPTTEEAPTYDLFERKNTPKVEEEEDDDIAYRRATKQSYVLENLKEAEAWFKTRFPQIDFSIAKGLVDGKAWGKMSEKAVILSDIAEVGTVYHEAFEVVYKYILTTPQILSLRKQFRLREGEFVDHETGKKVKYAEATNKQIKEQIAEEYRDFEMSGGQFTPVKGLQRNIFQKIWDFIHNFVLSLLGDPVTLDEVFKNISEASYKDRVPNLNLIGLLNSGPDYRLARIKLDDGGFLVDVMRTMTSLLFQDMLSHGRGMSELFAGSFDINLQLRNVKKRIDSFYGGQQTLDIIKDITVEQFITRFSKKDNYAALKARNKKLFERLEDVASAQGYSDGQVLTKLYDIFKAYEYIVNNWDTLTEQHKEYLTSYRLAFQEDDTVVELDDNGNMAEYVQEHVKVSAKENANTEIKLLIATLIKRDYVKVGKREYAKPRLNSLLMSELVDYGKTMNSLLYKLVEASSFEEMEQIIKDNLPTNPEYTDLISKLKIGIPVENLTKDDIDLRNKFYQTMSKMLASYDKLIITETGGSNLLDLNDEKGASLIRTKWLENLKSKQGDKDGLIYLNDDNQLTLNPKALKKTKLKTAQDFKDFMNDIGFTFPINLAKMSAKDMTLFQDNVAKIFNILKREDTEFVVADTTVLRTPLTALSALYIKYTNSYAEPQHFNIDREPVQNILLSNYIGITLKAFNKVTTLSDFIKKVPQLDMTTATSPTGVNGWHTYSQIISNNTFFFSTSGQKRRNINLSIIEGSEIKGEGQGRHSSKLNFADRLGQEFAYNLMGKYYVLTPADTKTEWALQFGHFVTKELSRNKEYVLGIMRNYLKAEILAVQQFKNSEKAGTPYARIQRLREKDKKTGLRIGEQLRLFQGIIDIEIPENEDVESIISRNQEKIDEAIQKWLDRTVENTLELLLREGVISQVKQKGELASDSPKYFVAFLPTEEKNELTLDEIRDLIRFADTNYIMNIMEQHKLFWGDPAMWKDITKRVKSFASGRLVSVNSPYFNEWNNIYSNRVVYTTREGDVNYVGLHPGDAGYINYTGNINSATSAEVSVRSYLFQSIKEHILNSKSLDLFKKPFTEISEEEQAEVERIAEPEYSPYGKMDESDGQGWAFLPGYREILQRSNLWNDAAESQYQFEMAYERLARNKYANSQQGERLKDHDSWLVHVKGDPKSFNFFVLKPIYAGLKAGNVFIPHLDKFSLAPVFYRAVENSQFKDVYLHHIDAGTHYLKLESGNKTGTLTDAKGKVPSFYNSVGTPNLEFVPDTLSFEHFGIQVETKTQKEHTTRGSQLTKLAVMNLLDAGVPIDYVQSFDGIDIEELDIPEGVTLEEYIEEEWDSLDESGKEAFSSIYKLVKKNNRLLTVGTYQARDELFREFGIDVIKTIRNGVEYYSYSFRDLSSIERLLQEELISRNRPENIKEFVKLGPSGQFVLPFDMLIGGDKIENILNAIVDKAITRPKLFGGAKPQISSTLMEKHRRDYVIKNSEGKWVKVPDITKLSEEDRSKAVMTSNELKFYTIAENGREITACEIMVPSPFRDLAGRTLKFSEVPAELLRGVGFRIPTQAVNSIEFFVIKDFLPDAYGDSVIVPSEIVAKAGTDFDIDKLNMYLFNYTIKNGRPEKIKFLTNDNSTLEERYVKYIMSIAEKSDVKYIKHLASSEYEEMRDYYAGRLAEIKTSINTSKVQDISHERLALDTQKQLLREDISQEKNAYMRELFNTGSQLFTTLNEDIKRRFWDLRDSLEAVGVGGAIEIMSYDQLAESILSSGVNSEDAETLRQMRDLYEMEIAALSRGNRFEAKYKELAYKLREHFNEQKLLIEELHKAKFAQRNEVLDKIKQISINTILLEQAQEIASLSNLPTLDTFKTFAIDAQNVREAVENEYVDNIIALLSLPQNYKQLVTANTAEALKELAKDISDLYKLETDKSLTRYLSRANNTFTRYAFQVGKDGVGIGAAGITNHAVNQVVNLSFERITGSYSIPRITFNLNNRVKRSANGDVTSDRYYLSRIRATDGSWISETINAFINAFVDVAKDPFIITVNGNLTTAGTYLMGVKLGIPLNDLVYWFSQPAIREYIRLRQQYQFSMNAPKALIARITEQERYKPDILGIVATKLGLPSERGVIDVADRVEEFNSENLRPIIKRFSDNGQDFSKMSLEDRIAQGQLLNQFKVLEDLAQELLSYNVGYSWDNRVTTTFDAIRIGFAVTQQSRESLFGPFIDKVFNETFIGSIFSSKVHVLQAVRGFFISESPKARAILDDMLNAVYYSRMSRADKEYYASDIRKSFITYLLQTTPVNFRGKNMPINSLIQELFLSDKNMVVRLRNIQKAIQDGKLEPNFFIQNAQGITPTAKKAKGSDHTNISNITLIKKPVDKVDSDLTTSALGSLSMDGKTTDFVKDLLAFALLQSGVAGSPISFIEVYPNKILIDMANEVFQKFISSGATVGTIAPSRLSYFKKSYYKNRWKDESFVPTDKRKDWQRWANIEIDGEKLSLFKMFVSKDDIYPTRIKANSKLKKDYYKVKGTAISPKTGRPYSASEKAKMAERGDFSFVKTDLYEKVRVINPKTGRAEGVVIAEMNKYGETIYQLLYRPVDKWGDGMYLTEHYNHDRASELYPAVKTTSAEEIYLWAQNEGFEPKFFESDFLELTIHPELQDSEEETFGADVIKEVDASEKAMLEAAGKTGAVKSYAIEGKSKQIKRFRPLDFKARNYAQLIAEGKKTAITTTKEETTLEVGESGTQKVLGKLVKITYLGLLSKKEADTALGIPVEQAEGFEFTPTKAPTDQTTKSYLKGKGKKHVYRIDFVNDDQEDPFLCEV